jgi:hypothetical protein
MEDQDEDSRMWVQLSAHRNCWQEGDCGQEECEQPFTSAPGPINEIKIISLLVN